MPAKKPSGLHTRHSTRAEKAKRTAQEESLQPGRSLPTEPVRLDGHPIAAAAWRRLMREFGQLEAVIVTRLDIDLLVDYCILMEQSSEIDRMRKVAYETWLCLGKQFEDMNEDGESKAAEEIAMKVVNLFDAVIKLDRRADRKRDMLLKLRQAMYLTPRARAAADPKKKEKEAPEDPFEKMLNDLPAKVPTKSSEKLNSELSGDDE